MLRVFRNSKKTVLFILVLGAVVIGMSSFGVSMYGSHQGQQRPVISVGETHLQWDDVSREKRNLEAMYRQMLGENAAKLLPSLNLQQQVVDSLVDESALDEILNLYGFTTGDQELKRFIRDEVFRGQPVSSGNFAAFAQSQGLTGSQLEQKLALDERRTAFKTLLKHASAPSMKEVEAAAKRAKTEYAMSAVRFDTKDLLNSIPEPEASVLDSFYQENASTYLIPKRVSFEWAEISEEKSKSLVEVLPEDVEFFYASHEDRFKSKEAIRADAIIFKIPAGTLPDAVEKIRARADDVKKRIDSGASFSDLMVEFSDVKSQPVSADGFLERGLYPKEVEEKAYRLQPGEITDVIRTLEAFYILRVKEIRPPQSKPLESVRAEVESALRSEQAPLFALNFLEASAKEFLKNPGNFSEFAKQKGFSNLGKTTEAISVSGQNPSAPTGLAEELLQQGVSVGVAPMIHNEKSYLVNVLEVKDEEIPGLSEVRQRVIALYKQKEARKKAELLAKEFQASITPDVFSTEAQKRKLKIESVKGISQEAPGTSELLKNPTLQAALFAESKPRRVVQGPLELNDGFLVWMVDTVTFPPNEKVKEKLDERLTEIQQQAENSLLLSLIEKKKAETEVVVDPSLFNGA